MDEILEKLEAWGGQGKDVAVVRRNTLCLNKPIRIGDIQLQPVTSQLPARRA